MAHQEPLLQSQRASRRHDDASGAQLAVRSSQRSLPITRPPFRVVPLLAAALLPVAPLGLKKLPDSVRVPLARIVLMLCVFSLGYMVARFRTTSKLQISRQLTWTFLAVACGCQTCVVVAVGRVSVCAFASFCGVILFYMVVRIVHMSRSEAQIAAEDPIEWHGVEGTQLVTNFASRPRPSNNIALCNLCSQLINGVPCYSAGEPVHFGCATESEQERAVSNRELTDDARQTLENFHMACAGKQHMYPFSLEVERLFTIQNAGCQAAFEGVQSQLISPNPNIKRLYHGTSCRGAKSIIANGFELPDIAGMFGKGVYFADVPLKSWQYSNKRFLLVCDVALGSEKTMLGAAPGRFVGDCDSVVGVTMQQGGALRLSEYVVYRPEQILPLYLLQLREYPLPFASFV